MMNRCDSVDALMYAYDVYMRMKENRMLEKDKNCIEFSMRSMVATHKPYQEDTEITIAGLAPGKSLLFAINPFDIPCEVVVVPKRDFERLQKKIVDLRDDISGRSTVIEYNEREIERLRGVLRRSNSVMLKTLEQEIDTWQKATGCNTPEEAEKKIKLLVDDINVLMRVTED